MLFLFVILKRWLLLKFLSSILCYLLSCGGCCLGTNYAQDFDLNVGLDSIDVDDVAPHTIKLSDAKLMHHCYLVSY